MLQPNNPEEGREIDGYRILKVLGRGGMGIVYLAEDIALSRQVALKMIDPVLARDEAFLRRFRSEARALARIQSPYIVSVHALRNTESGVFIVMEYVDGGTLADTGRISWQRAIPFIKQILTALEHAHSVGVIHRDIKPSNIMISKSGAVKVTDFGLAKLREGDTVATVTQGIAGTLYYMSPEQVKGVRDLDHRSDIYSLGMTAYEMLAGQLPFDKSSGEFTIMRMIVEGKLASPGKYNKDLPDGLVRIIMKALEKDPDRRYQRAAEMREALEAFEREYIESSSSADETVVYQQVHTEKKRGFKGAIAAILIVLVCTAGYLAYSAFNGTGETAAQNTRLFIQTIPAGAEVWMNGRMVGLAPDTLELTGRSVSVQVEKEGFMRIDTVLQVRSGQDHTLDLALAELVEEGKGETKQPESEGSNTGHSVSQQETGETSQVDEQETLEETPPDPPALASITFSGSPSGIGSLLLDSRSVRSATPVQVEPGSHVLECEAGNTRASRTIELTANASAAYTCYFERRVNVATSADDNTSPFGTIWLDGKQVGMAPGTLTLRPGTYEVDVRIERGGYESVDGPQTITIEPSFDLPAPLRLVFEFRKTEEYRTGY